MENACSSISDLDESRQSKAVDPMFLKLNPLKKLQGRRNAFVKLQLNGTFNKNVPFVKI